MVGYNGTVNGYFKGSRGLRQGDPLSPNLFVIAMNCLSYMIKRAATQEGLSYHPNCKKIKFTHLYFVDDLLIFIDGSLKSVQHVLSFLHEFELRSGLKVSMQKTSLTPQVYRKQRKKRFKPQLEWFVEFYLFGILEFLLILGSSIW